MNRKIVFGVAATALAVLVMAPSASASCTPAKTANTFGSAPYAYWQAATVPGTVVGQAWQLGGADTYNSALGTVPCTEFGYFSGPGFTFALDLGSCGGPGCAGGTLATLIQNQTATGTEFLVATVVEDPSNPFANFNYAPLGNLNMIPIPRPRVLSSSRSGTDVILSVGIDSIAGGLYGPNAASAVSGFSILGASSTSDPGRSAAAYTPRASAPSAGGAAATVPVTVDCSNPASDQWLVTQISFENGAILSNAVGAATRVNCNPALATPKNPKVKVAPKRSLSN